MTRGIRELTCLTFVATALVACGGPSDSPTAPLPESLRFTGDISGILTSGINVQPVGGTEPDGRDRGSTRCFDYQPYNAFGPDGGMGYKPARVFAAVIVGEVDNERIALGVATKANWQAYSHPNIEDGLDDSLTYNYLYLPGDDVSWPRTLALQDPPNWAGAKVTIDQDHKGGTLDARYLGKNETGAGVRVSGRWRCG